MKLARFWTVVICLLALSRSALALQSRSTFRLEIQEGSSTTTGSGMYVQANGSLWLVTAYHNVRQKRCNAPECMVAIVGASETKLRVSELLGSAFCPFPDLGVVAARVSDKGANLLNAGGATPARLEAKESPGTVNSVVAVGNPQLSVLKQTSQPFNYIGAGTVGARSPANEILPANATTNVADNTPLLFIDGFTITYGFSGGPVFASGDVDGAVLGMIQGGDPINKNRSWAIPSDLIYARLQSGCVSPIPVPFTATQNWPQDGFPTALYSREEDVLVDVLEVTPTPQSLNVDEKTQIAISFRWNSGPKPPALLIRPNVSGLPWLEHTGGLSNSQTPTENLDLAASFELLVKQGAPTRFTLPVEFVDTNANQVLVRINLPFSIEYPEPAVWDLRAGVEFPNIDPLGSLRLNYAPVWPLGDRSWSLALHGGGGVSALYSGRKVFDPVGRTLDQAAATPIFGVRLETTLELRQLNRHFAAFRADAGFLADYFFFSEVAGTGESVRHYRIGPTAAIGVSIRPLSGGVLVLRTRGTYAASPTLDSRYTGFSSVNAVATGYHVSGGIELSYEL